MRNNVDFWVGAWFGFCAGLIVAAFIFVLIGLMI